MDTSKTTIKNINVSIRKMRETIANIKKLAPAASLDTLRYMPGSAPKALYGVIKSAITNATTTLKVTDDMLQFRRLSADQGLVLKRFRAGSRGTASPILRRMTHVTVELAVKSTAPVVAKKSEAVTTKKPKKAPVKKATKSKPTNSK